MAGVRSSSAAMDATGVSWASAKSQFSTATDAMVMSWTSAKSLFGHIYFITARAFQDWTNASLTAALVTLALSLVPLVCFLPLSGLLSATGSYGWECVAGAISGLCRRWATTIATTVKTFRKASYLFEAYTNTPIVFVAGVAAHALLAELHFLALPSMAWTHRNAGLRYMWGIRFAPIAAKAAVISAQFGRRTHGRITMLDVLQTASDVLVPEFVPALYVLHFPAAVWAARQQCWDFAAALWGQNSDVPLQDVVRPLLWAALPMILAATLRHCRASIQLSPHALIRGLRYMGITKLLRWTASASEYVGWFTTCVRLPWIW